MDVGTLWRLLRGPVRPFLLGKVLDRFRSTQRLRWAQRVLHASPTVALHHLASPLPPASWLATHGQQVVQRAAQQRNGVVDAYGLDRWNITTMQLPPADPRARLELARMHQWPTYAVACHLTGDRSWFQDFQRELQVFQREHPACDGPMWNVAMDSAIRAVNALIAWDWFVQAGFRDHATDEIVARLARDHALGVWAHLETAGGMATSHLLGDLVGLAVIEAYLDQPLRADVQVWPWLEREMQRQLLDDGMSFEASTGYHRQVVDLLRVAYDVAERSDRLRSQITPEVRSKVHAALHAQAVLEDIGMPLIGDNDDGLCIKLLNTPTLACSLPSVEKKSDDRFPDFGLWIRRYDDALLTMRHGPVGQYGKGGHAHNDLNAVTLTVKGRPIIIDPGSAVYTADVQRRNTARCTHHHATVSFDTVEQRWWPPHEQGLFWMLEEPGTRPHVHSSHEQWQGTVRHAGASAHEHQRTMTYGPRMCIIHDRVSQVPASIMIPLASNVKVQTGDDVVTLAVDDVVVHVRWKDAILCPIHHLEMSPAYGVSMSAQLLELRMTASTVQWTCTW